MNFPLSAALFESHLTSVLFYALHFLFNPRIVENLKNFYIADGHCFLALTYYILLVNAIYIFSPF
jgi:hypothetical protein